MPNGYYIADRYKTISIDGPDRHDYLQRLSSRNFKNPRIGDSFEGAFLNANGTVISLFHAILKEDQTLLLVEPQSLEKTLAFLDKFHFGESLSFKEDSRWHWVELRSEKAISVPSDLNFSLRKWDQSKDLGFGMLLGFQGEVLIPPEVQKMVSSTYDFYRMKNFVPKDQVDIGESQIILEAGLYSHVSRNKGCYPGQEVIERLFTYGNVAKKLVLFEAAGIWSAPPQSEIFYQDKKVGFVTSSQSLNDQTLIFGVVQRVHALADQHYDVRLGEHLVSVRSVIIAPDVPKD